MIPRALAPAPRRLLVLLTALAATVAGTLTLAAPAAAAPDTLEGVVRLIADAPGSSSTDGTESGEQLVLVVGDKTYEVEGRALRPNTRVRVSGLVSGRSVDVSSATTLTAAASSLPTTGTTKTLVMLVSWGTLAPDAVTTASATAQLFTEDNAWYREASYGALGLSGNVTPWLRITGPAGNKCYGESAAIMSQAKAAAAAKGFTLSSYTNFVVYFPKAGGLPGSDCAGPAGWAYVGAPNVWLNGYLDRHTTVHELGHNYGLSHSDSYICPRGGVAATGCTLTEYGDYYDAMGNWSPGHFSAPQKQILGWLGGGRSVDLTAGGSATLVPMAQQSTATHAARVRVSATRTYWLEHRQRIGFDSALSWGDPDGVLVHVDDDAIGTFGQPDLIDVSPGDGVSQSTASLKAGTSWTSPEGFRIAVGTVGASGAQVTVTALSGDSTAPRLTARTPATHATAVATAGNLTLTFSEPVIGVSGTTFTVTTPSGKVVPAAVSYNATTRVATLNPTASLPPDVRYTARITGGTTAVRDRAGNPLTSSAWTFTTGPAPTVSSRYPAIGQGSVPRTANVAAVFSEPVQGLTTTTATLRSAAGTAVPAVVAYDATTRRFTLNPSSTLAARTVYTATLTGGTTAVRDRAGNPLTTTRWTFTTGA